MTTTEIRARVHAAFGEPRYPANLADRVALRLDQQIPRRFSRANGLIAALLAILLIAALVLSRAALGSPIGQTPTPAFKSNQVVGPVSSDAQLPPADISAAGLNPAAGHLVTPLNLTASSSGIDISLIGAYADTAETILFFRSTPPAFALHVEVYDRTGFLNYGAGGSTTDAGDSILILNGRVHPQADGFAHLDVGVADYQGQADGSSTPGSWNFSFDIKVQPPTALILNPPLSSIGPWKVNVEALEATPGVVHFQVVVEGASASQLSSAVVTLVDPAGHEVQKSSEYSQLLNQMFFFLVIGEPETRLYVVWVRPPAGAYELRISGHGFDYKGSLRISAGQSG